MSESLIGSSNAMWPLKKFTPVIIIIIHSFLYRHKVVASDAVILPASACSSPVYVSALCVVSALDCVKGGYE